MIKTISVNNQLFNDIKKLTQLSNLHTVEQYVDETIGSVYQTFLLQTTDKKWVLKKATKKELAANQKLLSHPTRLPVPKLLHFYPDESNYWLLFEHFSGKDLQILDKKNAALAGKSLATITNCFYDSKTKLPDLPTSFLEKLSASPHLLEIYHKYNNRQKQIPTSFVNDDCLPTNILCNAHCAVILDWTYGHTGSYVKDVGRLFAFFSPNQETFELGFTFLDSDDSKKYLLKNFYQYLSDDIKQDISFEQFKNDVALEVFYQYLLNVAHLETIVPESFKSDWDKFFYKKATEQALLFL